MMVASRTGVDAHLRRTTRSSATQDETVHEPIAVAEKRNMLVADQVKSVIVTHLGLDAHTLAPEALLRDGLGADSLDAFELLMAFEDEFDIVIPDEDAGTMQCVQDAIRHIESRVTAGTDGAQSPLLGSVRIAT